MNHSTPPGSTEGEKVKHTHTPTPLSTKPNNMETMKFYLPDYHQFELQEMIDDKLISGFAIVNSLTVGNYMYITFQRK